MKFLKKLSLSLLSVVIVLVLLIILDKLLGFKIKSDNQNLDVYNSAPGSTAEYKTGEFTFKAKMNNLGYRGPDVYPPRGTDTIRIMLVGNSFTYGWGVSWEDSWPAILEKELPAKIGKKVQILNFSRPGSGPYNYREHALNLVKIYEPDYFLIGLVEGNDLSLLYPAITRKTDQSENTKRLINHYLAIIGSQPFNTNFIANIFPHLSHLFGQRNVVDISKIWKNQLINDIVKPFNDEEAERFERLDKDVQNKFLSGFIQPYIVYSLTRNPDANTITLNIDDERTKNAISSLKSILSEITSEVTNYGGKTVIVDIPYDIFVSEKYAIAQKSMGLDFVNKSWESDVPVNIAKQVASSSGAFLISNPEIFRTRCQDNCYFYYDSHLNKNGQRIIADLVISEMEKIIKKGE